MWAAEYETAVRSTVDTYARTGSNLLLAQLFLLALVF
jgi:hypothetical protein